VTYIEIVDGAAEILAALHSGIIKYDCATCVRKEELNCSKKVNEEEPVAFHNTIGEFYTCPIRMVPEWVNDWFDDYQHAKMFTTAPDLGDTLQIKWDFYKRYESYHNKFQLEVSTNPRPADPGEKKKALSAFRQAADKNKKKE
jgi:hypothetical protein